jgi:hypothetical protein
MAITVNEDEEAISENLYEWLYECLISLSEEQRVRSLLIY